MSKKSSGSKTPKQSPPQSEKFYEDGFLRSSRTYDPSFGGYVTQSYSQPGERGIMDTASGMISGLLGEAGRAFKMTPEAIASFQQAYRDPQERALNQAYDEAMGGAKSAANAAGVRDSVGFNRYKANVLDKNRAEGLADIAANAKLMEYELPKMALSPYADAFNLYNAALSGEQAHQFQGLEPSFTGSQATNNYMNARYANQLAAHQLDMQRPRSRFLGIF